MEQICNDKVLYAIDKNISIADNLRLYKNYETISIIVSNGQIDTKNIFIYLIRTVKVSQKLTDENMSEFNGLHICKQYSLL